jgi:quinol monooxygenase YgiN
MGALCADNIGNLFGRHMTQPKQYIVTIGFRAKPGKAEELEQKLRQRVPISRTEAGTLDYRLYRSNTNDHVYFLFSRFVSEKSFDVHLYSPWSVEILGDLDELLVDAPRVETYETVLG